MRAKTKQKLFTTHKNSHDCGFCSVWLRKEMFLNMFMTKVWDGLKLDHIILKNLNHVMPSTHCPTHWPVLRRVPLGTEWLLISANCLWVRTQSRTLPATSARMNKHLVSSHSTVGDGEMCNGGVIEREGEKKALWWQHVRRREGVVTRAGWPGNCDSGGAAACDHTGSHESRPGEKPNELPVQNMQAPKRGMYVHYSVHDGDICSPI